MQHGIFTDDDLEDHDMGYHYGRRRRRCPVCRTEITGRADKIYCSADCRVYANNEKRRTARDNPHGSIISAIEGDLAAMNNGGGRGYIKIISLVTRLCKIMYKFGR